MYNIENGCIVIIETQMLVISCQLLVFSYLLSVRFHNQPGFILICFEKGFR